MVNKREKKKKKSIFSYFRNKKERYTEDRYTNFRTKKSIVILCELISNLEVINCATSSVIFMMNRKRFLNILTLL